MQLEKYQRNAIFEEIVAGGLDPHECALTEDDRECRVIHVPSGSYFILAGHAGHYTGDRVVGASTLSLPYEAYTWASVEERVRRWAGEVKRDLNTPDLWADLQRERDLLGPRFETFENTPFAPDEQGEIAEALREIKEYVRKTYSLSGEQMLRVESRFEEAEAAARRMGRRDWRLLFFGVMFEVIVTGLVPEEGVRHILGMALRALDHLFGLGGGPPQLPPMA